MTPPDAETGSSSRQTLLVFASVPPPVHGQNVMVAAMLAALQNDPAFRVVHVDARLSRTTEEVGRGSAGKLFRLLFACLQVWWARIRLGRFTLYYVPAPGQRVPVLRDWIALTLCRPIAQKTIFHWHAVGLGTWTRQPHSALACALNRRAFHQPDLSIVLAPELAEDAASFQPQRTAVVPNGIPEPLLSPTPEADRAAWPSPTAFRVLFLGLGNESKGLFRTVEAVIAANAREPGAFQLTFAGSFATAGDEQRFRAAASARTSLIQWVGFADASAKARWYGSADVLCFPTQYPNEGQPLVILEALAHDLPIIASRWRAVPGLLPESLTWRVEPDDPGALVEALFAARRTPREPGVLRRHYEQHFTLEKHLLVLKETLRSAG